jgi:purine catabolism regulator
MLTVRSLVQELGLELAAGEEAADAPVRWVHITELPDPTPWLSGGELLLTTGIQLGDEKSQREFVRRLAGHQLAGLGFGTGFDHDELPKPLRAEAEKLGFPVFEVPYELPFIALTERAFTTLVNEQYDVLQRGIGIHRRLERLVLEERGLEEVVRALAAAIGGAVAVLGSRGETIASKVFRRKLSDEAVSAVREEVRRRTAEIASGAADAGEGAEFAPEHPELAGRALVLGVAIRGRGAPQAWLVAARDGGGLGDFERLILNQAVTVVALELMRQRAMRDTERRLAGDVLAEALTGRLSEQELSTRLEPFGVGGEAAVLVFAAEGDAPAPPLESELDRFLSDAGVGALVATREQLLCAVVDCDESGDPAALAERAREALAAAGEAGQVDGASAQATRLRAAVSRPAPVAALRRTFHEARCALEASALANGAAPRVATYRDLGAFQLLLSLQDDDALRLYCDSVLGPLEESSGEYGDELIRSLEAFIEQNGQWEKAARQLYCHRHTLRYRIRRVEELTGRDLGSARDRIEFWLALRARELVS